MLTLSPANMLGPDTYTKPFFLNSPTILMIVLSDYIRCTRRWPAPYSGAAKVSTPLVSASSKFIYHQLILDTPTIRL